MAEPELELLSSKIDAGVKAAIAAAIERHCKLGQSISIMQDGKVVTLTADEIPVIQKQHNNINQCSSERSPHHTLLITAKIVGLVSAFSVTV